MVAACRASRDLDAHAASELGALVHSRGLIEDQRWRLEAVVALVPVLVRYGVALHRIRDEVRIGVRAAVCPAELIGPLVELLELGLAGDDADDAPGLSGVIAALWTPHLAGAATAGVAAALALDDVVIARRIAD